MRPAVLSFALALLPFASACGGSDASSAAGTYSLEADMSAMAGKEGVTAEQLKQMKDMFKGEMKLNADMTFEGSTEAMGMKSSVKGTWKLDGSKITMTTTEEDGKKPEKPESMTGTWKDGTITVKPPAEAGMPEMTIVMKKK